MEIVGTRGQILMAKCTKIDFGWGYAPDLAEGAYDAPPDPLVGWGGDTPSPYSTPSAPMAPRPLAPRSSRLWRSAASQRLKPTLLLPSRAATARGIPSVTSLRHCTSYTRHRRRRAHADFVAAHVSLV